MVNELKHAAVMFLLIHLPGFQLIGLQMCVFSSAGSDHLIGIISQAFALILHLGVCVCVCAFD